jgi:hypothetical protein
MWHALQPCYLFKHTSKHCESNTQNHTNFETVLLTVKGQSQPHNHVVMGSNQPSPIVSQNAWVHADTSHNLAATTTGHTRPVVHELARTGIPFSGECRSEARLSTRLHKQDLRVRLDPMCITWAPKGAYPV